MDGTMDTAGAQIRETGGLSALATLEHRLSAKLAETADEIQHVECFDDEQRAEIFAILQALRTDTEAHRAMADLLARQLYKGAGDA
jgi:selenocysteine lyase/cysteine desulfurase